MPVQVRPESLGPEAVETPSANGLGDVGLVPDSAESKLLALIDATIREKRDAVLALEGERNRINDQLIEARAAAKGYEDMRKRALGRPLRSGRPPGAAKPGPKPKDDKPYKGTRVSPERIEGTKADIVRWVETNGDEFSQVDIRSMPGAAITHSGAIAYVFEQLREEGYIRWVRKTGQRHMFRLGRDVAAAAAAR